MTKTALIFCVILELFFFVGEGNCFELNTPFALSPANGAEFTKEQEEIVLEITGTDGAAFIEYWVDNNEGFGSPEIGFNNNASQNYTGNDGIVPAGNNLRITSLMQIALLQNAYYWKARLLNSNKHPVSDWTWIRGRKWFVLNNKVSPPPEKCKIDSISPASKEFAYEFWTGSAAVDVNLDNDCSWTATANNSWISITSGSNGTGDGTINYSVSENTSVNSRTGSIVISISGFDEKQTFTITQSGKSEPQPNYFYNWQTSDWSACSQCCGNGLMARDVWCERNDGVRANDNFCAGTKLSASQTCNDSSCCVSNTYLWQTSDWSACSTACGTGEKTHDVWCERNDGTRVNDSYCSADGKPGAKEICSNSAGCKNPESAISFISPNPAEQGQTVLFSGTGNDPDGGDVSFLWTSGIGGNLSSYSAFSCSVLSVGIHAIVFRVTDDEGVFSEKTASLEIKKSPASADPIEIKNEELASGTFKKGEEKMYYLDCPDGVTAVIFKTEGGTGDAVDLYVCNGGHIPEVDSCFGKSINSAGDERIRIDACGYDGYDSQGALAKAATLMAFGGRYYILVKAQGDGGDYNFRARYLELRFPFAGECKITRGYDEPATHQSLQDKYALDFAQSCYDYGRPILAPEKSKVKVVKDEGAKNYGRSVTLDYGDGYITLHGHFSTVSVRQGITVQKGQEIGTFGNTGNCVGSSGGCVNPGVHQHFVFRKDGRSVKPEDMGGKNDFQEQRTYSGEPISNPAKFIIVDEQNASRNGTAKWNEINFEGYLGNMLWTNGTFQDVPTAIMTWTPDIPEDGNYKVYAHIPRDCAKAKVKYKIVHNGQEEIAVVNQKASAANAWKMLSPAEGWHFKKGKGGYAELNNANGAANIQVGFDAVMFAAVEYGPAGGFGPESLSVLKNYSFENSDEPEEWFLEDHNGAAFIRIEEEAGGYDGGRCLLVNVASKQENFYAIQMKQRGVVLQNGADMTLLFQFQSDQPGKYYVSLEKDSEPYNSFGLFECIDAMDAEWHEYNFKFTVENNPEECPESVKLTFHFGETAGIARIDNVILQKMADLQDKEEQEPVVEPEPEPEQTGESVEEAEPEVQPQAESISEPELIVESEQLIPESEPTIVEPESSSSGSVAGESESSEETQPQIEPTAEADPAVEPAPSIPKKDKEEGGGCFLDAILNN